MLRFGCDGIERDGTLAKFGEFTTNAEHRADVGAVDQGRVEFFSMQHAVGVNHQDQLLLSGRLVEHHFVFDPRFDRR